MSDCLGCAYFDELSLNCTAPTMLQDGKQFRPPEPETFVCPYHLSKETALLDRLVSALGIVSESGHPSGDTTLVLPDGSKFLRTQFSPWQDLTQCAHLWHLVRTRGIFIYYGPVPDPTSNLWRVWDDTGIERNATFHTATKVILEVILARLEYTPPVVTPAPAGETQSEILPTGTLLP